MPDPTHRVPEERRDDVLRERFSWSCDCLRLRFACESSTIVPMEPALQFAFIDESGNIASSRQNHILVVAALGMDNSRSIARIIRKTQKKYGSSLASGELKAKKSDDALTESLLTALVQEKIEIFSVIIDRRVIEHLPEDPEDVYRWAVARLVVKLVKAHPNIEIVLDRRYTKENLRYLLEKKIREAISGLPQRYVMIRQEDSMLTKELQAVDFIAWAFFQKYERGNTKFHDWIAARIIEEELVTKQAWQKQKK